MNILKGTDYSNVCIDLRVESKPSSPLSPSPPSSPSVLRSAQSDSNQRLIKCDSCRVNVDSVVTLSFQAHCCQILRNKHFFTGFYTPQSFPIPLILRLQTVDNSIFTPCFMCDFIAYNISISVANKPFCTSPVVIEKSHRHLDLNSKSFTHHFLVSIPGQADVLVQSILTIHISGASVYNIIITSCKCMRQLYRHIMHECACELRLTKATFGIIASPRRRQVLCFLSKCYIFFLAGRCRLLIISMTTPSKLASIFKYAFLCYTHKLSSQHGE